MFPSSIAMNTARMCDLILVFSAIVSLLYRFEPGAAQIRARRISKWVAREISQPRKLSSKTLVQSISLTIRYRWFSLQSNCVNDKQRRSCGIRSDSARICWWLRFSPQWLRIYCATRHDRHARVRSNNALRHDSRRQGCASPQQSLKMPRYLARTCPSAMVTSESPFVSRRKL